MNGVSPALDEGRMRRALAAAREAADDGETPVGAVIYAGDELVAHAHNQRERLQDPTAHAEMLALTQAAAALGSWRLPTCTLYVTLEPCAMCAGGIVLARLGRVVYGASDPKAGACGSVLDVTGCAELNHHPAMTGGVLADECGELLRAFFRQRRHEAGSSDSPGKSDARPCLPPEGGGTEGGFRRIPFTGGSTR